MELARAIVAVARGNGLACEALITDMDQVLGRTAGNAVEVREALGVLTHPREAEPRLVEVTLALCATLLRLGGLHPTTRRPARPPARRSPPARRPSASPACASRSAARPICVDDPDRHLPRAPHVLEVFPRGTGRVRAIAVRDVGVAVLELGGGRRREDDAIDHAVGLVDVAGLGEEVGPGGRPLAVVHARDAGGRAGRRARARGVRGRRRRPRAAAHRAGGRRSRDRRSPSCTSTSRRPRRPKLVRRLAARNGLEIPPGTIDGDRYVWTDFLDFLRTFDRAVTVVRTAEDYRDITFEYLQACAAEGAIYVEVTASPDHADQAGLSYGDMVAGVAQGIDDARAASGIESRIVVTAVRNFGTERAEWVARTAAAQPHPYVTGFGLAGDEAGFPPGPFARAYEIAHAAGLGLTCHAGEWAGPESVRGALALPGPVTRLGHGVRAVEDPRSCASWPSAAPCSRSVRRRTSCSTPTRATGSTRSRVLRDAGVRVTLGSDDPPYWEATSAASTRSPAREWGLDDDALRAVTTTAIEAAFVPDPLRSTLLARIPQ